MWSCQLWSSIPMATKSSSFCSCTSNRGLGAYHCQPCPHFTEAQVCNNVHQLNLIPASIIQLGLLVSQDPLRYMDSCRSYSEAISMYERALALYPKGASTYAALGFTHHLQVSTGFFSRSLQPQWFILYNKTESIWNIKISMYSYSSYFPCLMLKC